MSEPGPTLKDGPRWHLGLTLLSLDRVQPFLADMGLQVASPSQLMSFSRDFVRRYRTLDDSSQLGDQDRLRLRRMLMLGTADEIMAAMGTSDGRRVVDWVEKRLPYEAEAASASLVLRRTLHRLSRPGAAPVVGILTPSGCATLSRLVAYHGTTTADLHRRLKVSQGSLMSAWDKVITDTYTPDASPMDWVEDTADNVAADSVWRQLMTSLSAPDRGVLLNLARREALGMGLSPDLVDDDGPDEQQQSVHN